MSRAYTAEEARKMFLDHMRGMVNYWANIDDRPIHRKLDGLAFSFLTMIDGATELPCFDIVVRPHESDKEFHTEQGEDYFEDGMVINDDCDLHDEWYVR